MPVVDRLEAVHPDRRHAPAAATCRKRLAQLLAAVGQPFTIGEPGDDVARSEMRRSSLGIGALFLLILKIGEPSPADQNDSLPAEAASPSVSEKSSSEPVAAQPTAATVESERTRAVISELMLRIVRRDKYTSRASM